MQLYTAPRQYQDAIDTQADIYDHARPDFPPNVRKWFIKELGISKGTAVLDIYSHTGSKWTTDLVAAGGAVSAVEPGDKMRAIFSKNLPNVDLRDARAEDLPFADGTFDVVTVAQSAHWLTINALSEIHRVLRPGGRFGLIYARRIITDPMQKAFSGIVQQHQRGFNWAEDRWRGTIAASPLFTAGSQISERFIFNCDEKKLVDHAMSLGFVASADASLRATIRNELHQFAKSRKDDVPLLYDAVASTCIREEGAPLPEFSVESLAMAIGTLRVCGNQYY